MSQVRLGKMLLRWCDQCNLPILESENCGVCQFPTRKVEVTPPGDIRPAFRHDIELVRKVVSEQFGSGTGDALLPVSKIAIMNKIPGLDRMDEVIVDGQVVGALRYDIGKGYTFVTRMAAARAIQSIIKRGYVIIEDDAIEFILKGLNLMAPGVADACKDVAIGDEVIVLTKDGRALCTGMARMTAKDMIEVGRGLAVKSRWFEAPADQHSAPIQTWEQVIKANEPLMRTRIEEAVTFIHKVMERNDLPAMISFSGGKDSLACLLLTLEAGLKLPIFFVDTGLEFPETIEHVHQVADRHNLELIVESAPPNIFFENLAHFGPPGKDYRWCCKTNKLGPTVQAILRHYPKGVLSFIGQRRYESEQRAEKPRVWKNPWTPGQIGASPIQDWTALHIWLYIFSKKEKYNPWYEMGLDRIGCFLCPASDLAELDLVLSRSSRSQEWNKYLKAKAASEGWPEEWLRYGLWRWKRMPDSIRKEMERLGVSLPKKEPIRNGSGRAGLLLRLQDGASPCISGYSIEGAFNHPIGLRHVAEILNIEGPVELNEEEGWCFVLGVRVFEEGAIIAKGSDTVQIRKNVERVRRTVVKAEECVGCGVCIARCDEGALTLNEDRLHIAAEKCVHCGRCAEPCPAISFGDSAFEL